MYSSGVERLRHAGATVVGHGSRQRPQDQSTLSLGDNDPVFVVDRHIQYRRVRSSPPSNPVIKFVSAALIQIKQGLSRHTITPSISYAPHQQPARRCPVVEWR